MSDPQETRPPEATEQARIDADRRRMAQEIVDGQASTPMSVDDWKRFARVWIETAHQHATNEDYYCRQRDDLQVRLAYAVRGLKAALAAIDRDRSGMAEALNKVKARAKASWWITEGRGSYEWDDDRYKAEVLVCLREVIIIADDGLIASGRLADAEVKVARAVLDRFRDAQDGVVRVDYRQRYEDLVRLFEAQSGPGVYPLGHLSPEERDSFKGTDAYRCGWNDAHMDHLQRSCAVVEQAAAGLSDDVRMLLASGEATWKDDHLSLNMNDTWVWASAWCPDVPAGQVAEVAALFRRYGRAGLLYWHSRQEAGMRSEFADVNRMVEFVRREEAVRSEVPDDNERAYHDVVYTIGGKT